jgi:hypothetical protein
MRVRWPISLVMLLGIALFPSPAHAQRCLGEDLAAIDQYCELLPGAEGAAPAGGSAPQLRAMLPRAARMRLERAGPAGRALMALPFGGRLPTGDSRLREFPGALGALGGAFDDDSSLGDGLRAVQTLGKDGEGLSDAFRWALLLSAIGLVGAGWRRHRRGPPGKADMAAH